MLYDLKNKTFVLHEEQSIFVINTTTLFFKKKKDTEDQIEWMFSDKLGQLRSLTSDSKTILQRFNKVWGTPEHLQKGLVRKDKDGHNIAVYDIEKGIFNDLKTFCHYKLMSRDGELVFYQNGKIMSRKKEELDRFTDCKIHDGRRYKDKLVLSTEKGLWYNQKYITNYDVEYNFVIIDDCLYWSRREATNLCIIHHFNLIQHLVVLRGEDVKFRFEN